MASRASPTSPIFASPFGVHRRGAPKFSRFRAGCAATPEAPLRSISAVLPTLPGFSARNPAHLARLARQRRRPGAIRADDPQSRPPLAQSAAWDRETRPARPARRHYRPHRAGHVSMRCVRLLNFRTGRLDPSHDAIAARPAAARAQCVNALARLRDLGMLSWQRRCRRGQRRGRPLPAQQETNAYVVAPPANGAATATTTPPPPTPRTLGVPERVPDPIEAAVAELTHGQHKASLAALEADPGDALARTLAAFGRAIEEREAGGFTGRQPLPRNTALYSNHTRTDQFAAPEPAPRPPAQRHRGSETALATSSTRHRHAG